MRRAGVSKALLVVDSDECLQRRWRELAAESDYACVCAGALSDARAELSSPSSIAARVDLVLIDERLPDGSGTKLLSLLDGLPAQPIVVMMSSNLDASICIELMRCGVAAVSKPIAAHQMRELLGLMDLRRQTRWPFDDHELGYQLSQRELEVLQLSVMPRPTPRSSGVYSTHDDRGSAAGPAPQRVQRTAHGGQVFGSRRRTR